MIDINLLEYLVTFHKEGSLLKASESLNLSQPSLSKAVQKLEDELIKGLINNSYDIIFINHDIKIDGCITKKLFQEHLYISVPPTHFICGMKAGVSWSDIDGQSFLLFSYVGYWETIVKNNLKRSRFLKNDDIEAMKEIAEFSSIPSFLTNLTINPNGVKNRINIPIINDSAYLNFYVVVKEKNKKILNLIHQ